MVFSEISIDRLTDYASLFPGRQLALLRQSVSSGNTFARLWVTSGVGTADTAVLWDFGNKGLYVGGDCSSNCSRDALRSLVREELAAVAHAAGLKFCSVRAVSPDVAAAVNDAFADRITASCRKLFHEHPLVVRTIAGGLAPDVEFVNIDRRLLDAGTVNGEQVAEEVRWMWPSIDRFSAQGWGVAAAVRGELVCWCTSEYVGPLQCGIGIETTAAYQNKGIGTATAARFIDEAFRRGRNPCWECDSENKASIRIAQKLGFAVTESTDWYLGRWA